MKKQSSVEWLIEQLGIEEIVSDCKKEYRDRYIELINQAKEIHKQEVVEAYYNGHNTEHVGYEKTISEYSNDYYKTTYEKEN